jgi:hypothetical protein
MISPKETVSTHLTPTTIESGPISGRYGGNRQIFGAVENSVDHGIGYGRTILRDPCIDAVEVI